MFETIFRETHDILLYEINGAHYFQKKSKINGSHDP